MKIAIVVPTYNEAANIDELLQRLTAAVPAARIIVVDDASPDGTAERVRAFSSPSLVTVIVRTAERGLGGAIIAGMREALANGAEHIVTIDADLSHAPEDVVRLLAAATDNHLTLGSRRVPGGSVAGWSRTRDLVSRAASGFSRRVFGLKAHDATTGFRVYRADLLRAIDLGAVRSRGYAFQEEMVMHAEAGGFSVIEIPIGFVDRQAGVSKLSLGEAFASLGALVRIRWGKFDRRPWLWLTIMIVAGLGLRYYLAPSPGSAYDTSAFAYWAARARTFRFLAFYAGPPEPKLSFPNYALYFPMLAVLGPAAEVATAAGRTLLKTPAIIGDMILAIVAYLSAKPKWKLAAAAFIIFNPVIWYDSAVFGQTDVLHSLFMVLAVLAAADRKYRHAWICTAVAVCFKIQAVAILPLIAAAHYKGVGLKKMFVDLLPAGALAVVISLPYVLATSANTIWHSLFRSVGMYPLVSFNAWNPWFMVHVFSGHFVNDMETVFGLSFWQLGIFIFALAAALIIHLLPKKPSRATLLIAASLMYLSFYCLLTEMHERYLYAFIPLIAIVIGESWPIIVIAAVASVGIFLDMNFVETWFRGLAPFSTTLFDCIIWSIIFSVMLVALFCLYAKRVALAKKTEDL